MHATPISSHQYPDLKSAHMLTVPTLVDLRRQPLLRSFHWPPHQFSPQPCWRDTARWSHLVYIHVNYNV